MTFIHLDASIAVSDCVIAYCHEGGVGNKNALIHPTDDVSCKVCLLAVDETNPLSSIVSAESREIISGDCQILAFPESGCLQTAIKRPFEKTTEKNSALELPVVLSVQVVASGEVAAKFLHVV